MSLLAAAAAALAWYRHGRETMHAAMQPEILA
jgi:hypothetical protein